MAQINEIIKRYLPLSLTAFGGPQAHIAMFHQIFVENEKWLGASTFAELFAISQALPGPGSTQMAYAIALLKHGIIPAIISHLIWSLPAGIVMIFFAGGIDYLGDNLPKIMLEILNGLTSAALGLVALAGYQLGQKLLTDKLTIVIATVTGILAICYSTTWLLPVLMMFGGITTSFEYLISKQSSEQQQLYSGVDNVTCNTEIGQDTERNPAEVDNEQDASFHRSPKIGIILFAIFGVLLGSAIVLRSIHGIPRSFEIWGSMYFVGSIIFGGGPVVIPLLQQYVVEANWLSNREFLIGLALINAMPGPNFNLGTFCGALALRGSVGGLIAGGMLGSVGIFMPGLLLITAIIPFWTIYRNNSFVKALFKGVNAGAVGLVFAALFLLSVKSVVDVNGRGGSSVIVNYPFYTGIAAATFSAVGFLKFPAPIAILFGGICGLIRYFL